MNKFQSCVQLLSQLKGVLLISLALTFVNQAQAENYQFQDSISVEKIKFIKRGTGKLVYKLAFIGFDVYLATLYQDDKNKDNKVMQFYFLRDVEKKYLKQGWEEGLKADRSKIKTKDWVWLNENTPDTKEGDIFELRSINGKFTMLINKKKIIEKDHKLFSKIIFNPWIGNEPVDEELKAKILGVKESD